MGEQEVLLVIFATYDEHIPRTGKDLCTGIKNDRSPDVGAAVIFVVGTGVWYVSQFWDMYQTPVPTHIGRYIKKALNVIKPDIQS